MGAAFANCSVSTFTGALYEARCWVFAAAEQCFAYHVATQLLLQRPAADLFSLGHQQGHEFSSLIALRWHYPSQVELVSHTVLGPPAASLQLLDQ